MNSCDSPLLAMAISSLCTDFNILVFRVVEMKDCFEFSPENVTSFKDGLSEPMTAENWEKYLVNVEGVSCGGEIYLREDLGLYTPSHLLVWIHEFAHELLHGSPNGDDVNYFGALVSPAKTLREVEADCVAVYVGKALNLYLPFDFVSDDPMWAMGDLELIVANKIIQRYRELLEKNLIFPVLHLRH